MLMSRGRVSAGSMMLGNQWKPDWIKNILKFSAKCDPTYLAAVKLEHRAPLYSVHFLLRVYTVPLNNLILS